MSPRSMLESRRLTRYHGRPTNYYNMTAADKDDVIIYGIISSFI